MIAPGKAVEAWLSVTGERGSVRADNPLAPQNGGAVLRVETADGVATTDAETSATYFHQLVAFRDAIVDGAEFPTTADDGVRNMEIVDACYRAAGLEPRPTIS